MPPRVVNAVTLSQGLNAGRFRDYVLNYHRGALNLNDGRSPIGCYNLPRFESAIHELQLRINVVGGDATPTDNLRAFRVPIRVCADHPTTMNLLLTNSNGEPLSCSFRRADATDGSAKKFAAGNAVIVGGKRFPLFSAELFMITDGDIPSSIRLKFRNAYWMRNKIYVSGMVEIVECDIPEPEHSNISSSVGNLMRAASFSSNASGI